MASPPFTSSISTSTPYCPTHWVNNICIGGSFSNCATPGLSCGWIKNSTDPYWQTSNARQADLPDPFAHSLCPTHYVNGTCVGGTFSNCAVPGASCGWVRDEGDGYWEGLKLGERNERAEKESEGADGECATHVVNGVCQGGGLSQCSVPGVSCKREEGEDAESEDPKEGSAASAKGKGSMGLALGLAVVVILGQLV